MIADVNLIGIAVILAAIGGGVGIALTGLGVVRLVSKLERLTQTTASVAETTANIDMAVNSQPPDAQTMQSRVEEQTDAQAADTLTILKKLDAIERSLKARAK